MVVTIETRLQSSECLDLITYAENYIAEYNAIGRHAWKILTGPPCEIREKKSKLNQYLQAEFGVSKRTASAIITEVKGKLSALKELKKYEISQLKLKIGKLEKVKISQKATLTKLKAKAKDGSITDKELETYKLKRTKYFNLCAGLNRKKQKLVKWQRNLANEKYSMCFGSKKLFKAQHNLEENGFRSKLGWRNAFIRNRDKNIFFLGSKDETYGNQEFQLSYDEVAGKFQIKAYEYLVYVLKMAPNLDQERENWVEELSKK